MNSLIKENTKLGFIGIGNMGSRIAKRLLEHGYQMIAYNRSPEAAEALVKHGATAADSVAMLASEADVILSSLTNDNAVKSVYTDSEGVFAHVRRGSAIIEMSTVLPATSRELYDLSREAGVKFLDSPVSGSTPSAEEGTLTLFCGGDEELFQAAQPIFSAISSQNFYLGSSGSGTAMKLVANTLLGVGMQAIAESVALGQKEGLDRHRLLEVLSHTAVVAPAHLGKLSRADRGDYSPQFAIRLMNKDFGLVLETAAAAKVPMPATAAAFQMNVAEFSEGKEEDFSAVITLMERLAQGQASDAGKPQVAGAVSS
ncbi:MAG: 3-hydroxyisobutyrate dehydrogenase [Blastocatellia bacterium]|jgi:3-hydroxyisobutyrate dehydrogenase-like beta-hydroxyacid dehydrogenase|nr:3-hydroxyisobutyrate dehydrogenase [Blastocatellia bacterium]